MAEPEPASEGLLDTCVVIDLPLYAPGQLPDVSLASAVSFAELSYGVALARSGAEAAVRSQALAALRTWLTPLPFDLREADKYGQLAALALASGRPPRARRLDLMIAATAVVSRLPLYTSNPDDFRGLESLLDIRAVAPLVPQGQPPESGPATAAEVETGPGSERV